VKIINFQILKPYELVLIATIALAFLIQCYYLLRYYLGLIRHKDQGSDPGNNQITIIIPVRNEEDRIREILDNFSEQEFKDYQLLVINENSEDNTYELLNVLAETNSRLKVTTLSQEIRFAGKQAINIGLKGASSPWIIMLTPFSAPINRVWLEKLNSLISSETEAVIAYTNVEQSNGMRNLLCRLERFNQFMVSGAWTVAGQPFVFNENNILFKKSMYFDTLGFRHKLNRNFANLELIFNENFKKGRVNITTNPELAVRERIEDDRGDHLKLLKKGVQIRQDLGWGKKISLFTDDLTRILVPILSGVFIALHPEYWLTFAALPFIHIIIFLIIFKILLNRLNERKLFLSSFIYIMIKPLVNWWLVWSMYLIHRRSRWN